MSTPLLSPLLPQAAPLGRPPESVPPPMVILPPLVVLRLNGLIIAGRKGPQYPLWLPALSALGDVQRPGAVGGDARAIVVKNDVAVGGEGHIRRARPRFGDAAVDVDIRPAGAGEEHDGIGEDLGSTDGHIAAGGIGGGAVETAQV